MSKTSIRQIIERDQLVAVTPSATVSDAAATMAEHRCGSVLVLQDETVVGIFTERDLLLRVVAQGLAPQSTPIQDVMTKAPDTIDANAPVADAIRAMDEFSYRYLPVLDQGRCVGVISTRHLPFGDVLEMRDEIETRHRLAERMR